MGFELLCSVRRVASSLLDHDINLVAVVHLERLWTVIILDSFAVKYKAALIVGEALALAVRFHQLLQLR